MTSCTPLYQEDEAPLVLQAQNGCLRAAERLVLSEMPRVKRIACNYCGRGVDLEDLVSEGICGVLTAIGKFKVSCGVRFTTFARIYAQGRICHALFNQAATVRVPKWQKRRVTVISLQDLASGDQCLEELLADDAPLPGHEQLLYEQLEEIRLLLDNALILTPREQYLLRARFGIGTPEQSQSAIANQLGLTQERVRQIYQHALGKCRRKLEQV